MKLVPQSLSKYVSTLLVAGLLGPAVLNAADNKTDVPAPDRPRPGQTPPGGGDRGGNRGGDRGGFGRGWMLDEQQRDLVREAMQKHSDALRKLEEKLQAAQKEQMQAMLAEKYDEKVVRQKSEAVAKIQIEIDVLRSQILSVVVPTLKPEQREQLENAPWALRMLTGGFGGMGGMGGGFRGPQPGGGGGGGQRGGGGGGGNQPPR